MCSVNEREIGLHLEYVTHLLMNKGDVVAELNINTGEHYQLGKLPIGFNCLNEWIQERTRYSCARDMEAFINDIGLSNKLELIDNTHCVSLNDTFWVVSLSEFYEWELQGRSALAMWKNRVSPFRNVYSRFMSRYSLEGITVELVDMLSEYKKSSRPYFSPDVATAGSFPHTWKFNGGDISFYKAGSRYVMPCANSGREPFSEYYASVVAKHLGFNAVHYDIRQHKRLDGKFDEVTACKCFTSEKIGSVPAHKLGLRSYEKVIDYCKKLGDDSYKTILDMLFLDCLLLNTDRHFGNIEFLFDTSTLEVIKIAPIFDNNFCLIPCFMEKLDNFNRSDYIARDDRAFDTVYKLVMSHKSYMNELNMLTDFEFEAPKKVKITPERLKFLNWLLRTQVEHLSEIEQCEK